MQICETGPVLSDTSEAFQELYWEALRRQTPAQRLNQAVELTNAVRSLFLANISHLDEATQRRRLAEACYGIEAVERIFGK